MVAEGVRTTKVCYFLSKKYNVYMPITENIYKVLYEGLSINECAENLMKKMAAEELNKFE
jgi:glycerol-3-phosphate dehydrogenase [NAD(P)+]